MDDKLVSITTEEKIAETSHVDPSVEQYEVDIGVPEFEAPPNNMTMDEIVVGETAADVSETLEIDIEEAVGWAGGDNTIHDNLAGRDALDQHPITAITGLRTELDQIESLQTVYSDKKQQADYYLWRQDETHPLPANPYGLFVSIYPETNKIQICDGEVDVFGVTVSDAAFVGNQEYVQAEGGIKTGRDGNYCLVTHSGLVGVRRMPSVVVGDYVVPNSRGEAEKSNGDYGYLVTAVSDADGLYAIISLSTPSTLAKKTADSVEDLSGRMGTAEYNITSVTNVANSAYALALDAKENANVSADYIEEKVEEVLGRLDETDGIIGNLSESVSSASTNAALAKTIAEGAVNSANAMKDEAVKKANEALDEASKTKQEVDQKILDINTELENVDLELQATKEGFDLTIDNLRLDTEGQLADFKKEVSDNYATTTQLVAVKTETSDAIAAVKTEASDTYATIESVTALKTETSEAVAGLKQEVSETYATQEMLTAYKNDASEALALYKTEVAENYATQEMVSKLETDTTKALTDYKQEVTDTYATQEMVSSLETETSKALADYKQEVKDNYATQEMLTNLETDTTKALTDYKQEVTDTYATQEMLTSFEGEINNAMANIKQQADENGAKIEALVADIDKYAVGEYSQAYGLTLEQAKNILIENIVYVPTVKHDGSYIANNQTTFIKGYYYTWDKEKWVPSLSTAVKFDSKHVGGSTSSPYWVVETADVELDVVETFDKSIADSTKTYYDKTQKRVYTYNSTNKTWAYVSQTTPIEEEQTKIIYDLGGLYLWKDNDWVKVASTTDNTLSRAVSAIKQTADSVAIEITNAKGDAVSLTERLKADEALIQGMVSWKTDPEGNEYNLATIKQTANDAGASIAQVVEAVGQDGKVTATSIVQAVNDGKSSINLQADKINFEGFTTFVRPGDIGSGGTTSIDGANIKTGTISADRLDLTGTLSVSAKKDLVASVKILYALSDSATEFVQVTEWSTTAPEWVDGKYMWQKTVTTYADSETHQNETIVCIQGAKGSDGKGVNIKGVAYTQESISDNCVGKVDYIIYSDSSHQTQITNPSDSDAYLIDGYLFVYSGVDNYFTCVGKIQGPAGYTPIKGVDYFDGQKGEQGAGVKKINTYVRNFSLEKWKTYSEVGREENWSTGADYDNSHINVGDIAYIVGTISDSVGAGGLPVDVMLYGVVTQNVPNHVRMASSHIITGGEQGQQGDAPTIGDNGHWFICGIDTGVKAEGSDGITPTIEIDENGYWVINGKTSDVKALGSDGKPGIYISEITEQYYLSISAKETIGGEWVDIVENSTLSIEKGKYRFRRQKYVWSGIKDDATENDGNGHSVTYSAARLDETDQRILDWCSETDSTLIDGGHIYAESLSAISADLGLVEAGTIQSNGYGDIVVWGEEEEIEGSKGLNYTLNSAGTSYSVTGIGACADTDVIILSKYNNLPVTLIGDNAFKNCTQLTSITMPDGVHTIGIRAFYGCSKLTSITIPDSVILINSFAFAGCDSLTSIIIPDSVSTIAGGVFANCSRLTIYCEATSQPSSWTSTWNTSSCPVYWYSEESPTDSGNYWHYNDEDGFKISCDDENMIESKYFKVTQDGTITATAGNIGGCKIIGDALIGGRLQGSSSCHKKHINTDYYNDFVNSVDIKNYEVDDQDVCWPNHGCLFSSISNVSNTPSGMIDALLGVPITVSMEFFGTIDDLDNIDVAFISPTLADYRDALKNIDYTIRNQDEDDGIFSAEEINCLRWVAEEYNLNGHILTISGSIEVDFSGSPTVIIQGNEPHYHMDDEVAEIANTLINLTHLQITLPMYTTINLDFNSAIEDEDFIRTPYFKVSKQGKIKATDAELSGNITATNGRIGGLTVQKDGSLITNNFSILNDNTESGVETEVVLDGLLSATNCNVEQLSTVKATLEEVAIKESCTIGSLQILTNGVLSSSAVKIDMSGSDSENTTEYTISFTFGTDYDFSLSIYPKPTINITCLFTYESVYSGEQVADSCTFSPMQTTHHIRTGWFWGTKNETIVSVNGKQTNASAKDNVTVTISNGANIVITGNMIPSQSNTNTLGNEDAWWSGAYLGSSTLVTSDKNAKNSIEGISESYGAIFDSLIPVSYKYNDGTSNRTHTGFIAQDVKVAVENAGLTTQDFAAYCDWTNKDGSTGCALRYEEFIALCVDQIQKLKKRVAELETKQNDCSSSDQND